MRLRLFAVACLATPVLAQAPGAADADEVRALNRAHVAEAGTRAPASDAEYRRQLADYEAAKARNDLERAKADEAARAFRDASAAHDAAMARWRAQVAGKEAPVARPASTQTASASDDRVICRADQETGSHLPKRVCLSAAQWRARAASNAGAESLDAQRSYHASQPH